MASFEDTFKKVYIQDTLKNEAPKGFPAQAPGRGLAFLL